MQSVITPAGAGLLEVSVSALPRIKQLFLIPHEHSSSWRWLGHNSVQGRYLICWDLCQYFGKTFIVAVQRYISLRNVRTLSGL